MPRYGMSNGCRCTRTSLGAPPTPRFGVGEAKRNGALQTPISGLPEIGAHMRASRASPTCVDRSSLWRSRISGAPLHFVTRCTASGTPDSVGRVRSLIHFSNSPDLLVPAAHVCVRGLQLLLRQPESRGGRSAERRSGAAAPVWRAHNAARQALARRLASHDAGRSPLGAPPWRF